MKLLYVIGAPGSGKTTLMRCMTADLDRWAYADPVPHVAYEQKDGTRAVAQIGRERPQFGGTDALHMAIQPTVEAWLDAEPYEFLFAEGDRLGNGRFFEWCIDRNIDLTVVFLNTPEKEAAKRRKARGSKQSETWLKGRSSKVHRLAARYTNPLWDIDGTLTPMEQAQRLREHPVMQALLS